MAATKSKMATNALPVCCTLGEFFFFFKLPSGFSSNIYELFVLISAPVAHNKQCWPVICQSWCQNSNFDR